MIKWLIQYDSYNMSYWHYVLNCAKLELFKALSPLINSQKSPKFNFIDWSKWSVKSNKKLSDRQNKIPINFYLILFLNFFELGSKFHRLPKSCTETLLSLTPEICFQPSNLIPWSSKPRFVIVKTSKPLSIPKTPSQLAEIWVSFRSGSLKIYWVQKSGHLKNDLELSDSFESGIKNKIII